MPGDNHKAWYSNTCQSSNHKDGQMPTPIDATQSQHCGQMKRAPPCSSVSSGMRGGRRAEDRSLPLSVLRFLLWQSDGNRATACFTGGEAGGRDAGTVPALEKRGDGGQRGKTRKKGWESDSGITEAPKVCFCFTPLYVSPGWRGRHSEALTSHRAEQGGPE